MMTPAMKLMKAAKATKSRTAWRMLKGKFDKELGKAGLSYELHQSALREFRRVAPMPKDR